MSLNFALKSFRARSGARPAGSTGSAHLDPPNRRLHRAFTDPPTPPRAEALRAVARYARLAAFSAACALYVLVRYVVLRPPRRKRHSVAPW